MASIRILLPKEQSVESLSRLRDRLARSLADAVPDISRQAVVEVEEDAAEADRRGAIDLVKRFLVAMEARRLDEAQALTGPAFRMSFPGGAEFTSVQDLVGWAKRRYRSVRKTFTGFDVVAGRDHTVVYCRGSLAGQWPDGSPFQDVRFIDRFEIREGYIVDQQVWNDLGETGAGDRAD